MSNPSRFQSHNFSISMFDRLTNGGGWIRDIDVEIQNWRHTISAFGGFDTATFDIVDTQPVIDDWVSNGLGRPIIAYDDSLVSMWEGFIDSIVVNQGGLSVTYGPISDIANQVFAIYSGVDTSVYPPQIGVRKKTPTFSDTTSQSLWGIWPEILSLAGVTDSNSDLLVLMYLKEHGNPETSSNFSFGKGNVSITVNCVGWYKTLVYPYNYTVDSGTATVDISTRIQQILTAQLNPWISSDYSQISPNTVPVFQYQNDDQLAIEQLRGYAAVGDIDSNRWLLGIYENRRAIYEMGSNKIDYEIKLNSSEQVILDPGGTVIPPWRVRPGKHVFFSDFSPGLGIPDITNLQRDPRILEIEQVQFDIRVPFSAQLTGGHTSMYEQKSARLGLRGMSI